MEENKKLFEEIPVPKALAKLAVPTIISQLIVMIYNLADTFFIGRTNDPYKVAATSMAYVLFFMLNALANLFGIGGIPATLSMMMSHLLRSEGYGSKASFGLSMGGILNLILDPLFMFVLFPKGQEVTGAAVATMLSNVVALAYYAHVFYRIRTSSVLSVSSRRLHAGGRYAGELLSVGFPAALSTTPTITPLATISGWPKRSAPLEFMG